MFQEIRGKAIFFLLQMSFLQNALNSAKIQWGPQRAVEGAAPVLEHQGREVIARLPLTSSISLPQKRLVLFVQISFDKEVSRSHLTVQPSINNDFLSQIFLSVHRETKLTKQTPGLPSFTGESTITWTLSHFSPWVCICFDRTNFMHEIVLILCI